MYKRVNCIKLARRAQRGFGLLEIVLSMIVISILAVVAYTQYNDSRENARIQDMTTAITTYSAKIQGTYSSESAYTGITLDGLVGNRVFPSSMVKSTSPVSVQNIYGGNVTATAGTLANTDDALIISETNVSKAGCSGVITNAQRAFSKIEVGTTTVKPYQGSLNIDLLGTACEAGGTSNTLKLWLAK